jgi:hypothetical protein
MRPSRRRCAASASAGPMPNVGTRRDLLDRRRRRRPDPPDSQPLPRHAERPPASAAAATAKPATPRQHPGSRSSASNAEPGPTHPAIRPPRCPRRTPMAPACTRSQRTARPTPIRAGACADPRTVARSCTPARTTTRTRSTPDGSAPTNPAPATVMRQPRHLSHGLKHLEPCDDHSLSQCVISAWPQRSAHRRRSARREPSPLWSLQVLGKNIRFTSWRASWDGGQRPRSFSNGCGHWPGPARPAGSARQGGQAGTAPRKRSSQESGRAGRTAAPLAQAVQVRISVVATRNAIFPGTDGAQCEALSLDIPGGLQCFAFTPERC